MWLGAGPGLGVGNPVNVASGNKYQREVDLPALDGYLGLELVRHYNSFDRRDNGFGIGWTLSYDTRLYRLGDVIQIVQADGSRVRFRLAPGADACVADDPAHGRLMLVGATTPGYVWEWPDGRRLRFDAAGRLVVIETPGGQVTIRRGVVPGRPDYRRIVRVVDPRGRQLRLEYGEQGVKVAHTPLGSLRYTHTHDGRLRAVLWPWGAARIYLYEPALQGIVRTGDAPPMNADEQGHDQAGSPRDGAAAMEAARARLTGIVAVNSQGRVQRLRTWVYDARGRVIVAGRGDLRSPRDRIELTYSDDPGGRAGTRSTSVRSGDGQVTRFEVAVQDGAYRALVAETAGCTGCERGGLQAEYDSAGRLRRMNDVHIKHDSLGRMVRLQDAAGATHIEWLADTRLPTRIDRPSVVPGLRHVVTLEWQPVAPTAQTAGRTRMGPAYRLGAIHEQGWRPRVSRQPLAREHATELDARAGPTVGDEGAGVSVESGPIAIRRTVRLHWETPAEHEHRFTVHASSAMPTAAPAEAANDAAWTGLQAVRDDLGHVVAWTSDATGTEVRELDERGRLVERVFADGTSWRYVYADGAGQARGPGHAAPWVDACRKWLAGRAGGATPTVEEVSGAPALKNVRSIVMTRPGGQRFVTNLHWLGNHAVLIESEFEHQLREYDNARRLSRVALCRPEDPSSSQAGVPQPGAPAGNGAQEGGSPAILAYEERFAYDAAGRIALHMLPEGGALHYLHADDGRLTRLLWQDPFGNVHVVFQPFTGGYQYANGVVAQGLLLHGSLHAMAHAHHGRPVWAQRVDYDSEGRVRAETSIDARGRRWHWQYDHDTRSRLGFVHLSGAESRQWWLAWRADGALQARAINGTPASVVKRIDDAAGLPVAIGERRLSYGPDRRLSRVDMPGADGMDSVAYWHNAFGERIVRQHGSVREHALYFRQQKVADWVHDERGRGIVRRYIYAGVVPVAFIEYAQPLGLQERGRKFSPVQGWPHTPAGALRTLLRMPRAGTLYFVHADALGLPRAVTDSTGRLRWQAEFTPFGEVVSISGDLTLHLRYPGQWYDPATGWHDNYLRTYDPGLGHYLEPDPLGPLSVLGPAVGPDPVPPTSPYGYAAQQPRRHADPSGLLLFAFDGTRQDFTTGSNVWQLAVLYRDAAQARRNLPEAYYHAGPGESGRISLDAVTAESADDIIDTQWQRLLNHLTVFQPTPETVSIDLLGYSRGAALARHFGNMLAQSVRRNRFWHWDDVAGTVTACIDLRFMGLFDTVAQMGLLGSRNEHYDFTLAPDWTLAAHAVALHEHRALFPLVSLGTTPDLRLPPNAIEQPFIGAHGDIGGGLIRTDAGATRPFALSDVTLEWMMQQAERVGVTFEREDMPSLARNDPVLHDARSRLERAAQRWSERDHAWMPDWLPVDRHVTGADGRRLYDRQGDHPRYGDAMRAEAERFITRIEGWLDTGQAVVGVVDRAGYEAWLRGASHP